MGLKKCPICGELFADTYKHCPFCEEDENPRKARQPKRYGYGEGGRRLARRNYEEDLPARCTATKTRPAAAAAGPGTTITTITMARTVPLTAAAAAKTAITTTMTITTTAIAAAAPAMMTTMTTRAAPGSRS